MNGISNEQTNKRTYERKDENYIPLGIKAGGININVSTRFYQIHQLFHKILNINIILKSIKRHNSVE